MTENPNEPSKAQGETHILIYMTFVSLVYGLILLGLNTLGLMYSPVSCYVPSDRVHEILAVGHEISSEFGCHPGEIHIFNDILSLFGNTIVYVFTIGPLNLFFKFKEGKVTMEKIIEDYEEERRSVMPT